MPHLTQPVWSPGPHVIEISVTVDPGDRAPASVVARHPGVPFVRYLDVGADNAATLQGFALEYLERLRAERPGFLDPQRDEVFRKWLQALASAPQSTDPRFGWLPLASPQPEYGHPMISYRFSGFGGEGQTVVLLASERLGSAGTSQEFLGSGFGLRVVGHLREHATPGPYLEFSIAGFSASLPFGGYLVSGVIDLPVGQFPMDHLGTRVAEQAEAIERALNLYRPTVCFTGLRLQSGSAVDTLLFEAQGTSHGYNPEHLLDLDGNPSSLPFAFYVRGTFAKGEVTGITSVDRVPLVAYATKAFEGDPMSQGPTRKMRERRATRKEVELDAYTALVSPLPASPFTIRPGRPVNPALGSVQPASSLRSDAFGELSARVNLDRFFARLDRYAIAPNHYFRVARRDATALCRAGIRPGPGKDGNTVNARVSLSPWRKSFFLPIAHEDRPRITMHFALADLFARNRGRRTGNKAVAAEPLGIAADPRWFWHEIGHVLLAASVGELELRFAHSAGDALAAIACDPRSQLGGGMRYATFPWVFEPRRHDRCAAHGWSWSGAMHRPSGMRAYPDRIPLKGYWSEQILSSSLFRLYRSIGGDQTKRVSGGEPVSDPVSRDAASEYAVYLIIKAIGLLGYAGAVPAHEPDHFVSALIDADIGTENFRVTVPDGQSTTLFERVGGCVHKVIRWAFEMQGLYAPKNAFRNRAGDPPPVDVYIPDMRPRSEATGYTETQYGPGSYAPVSLDWAPSQSPSPLWHAPAVDGIEEVGSDVYVTVGNRGTETATNVSVEVWTTTDTQNPPAWNPGSAAWTVAVMPAGGSTDILPNRTARFGPFPIPATRPLIVLASATCADDRANIDQATGLPCSRLPVRLADLVANDNNLGLREL